MSLALLPVDSTIVAAQQPGGSLLGALFPIILIMVIFYLLLILPAQRRQKKVAQMIAALKAGDRVVTNGGIYGTIVGFDETDHTIQLRIAEQVKIKLARSAIAGLQPEAKE
jgi:preprotein translocase subunit YajC